MGSKLVRSNGLWFLFLLTSVVAVLIPVSRTPSAGGILAALIWASIAQVGLVIV